MPTNVIMPALGLAQETSKVLRYVEMETDKVTVAPRRPDRHRQGRPMRRPPLDD